MVGFILPANSATGGYEISNSLRFGANTRLTREFDQDPTGNRKTFTISCWVKRSSLSSNQCVVSASTTSNFNDKVIGFRTTNAIEVNNVASGSDALQIITNRLFRDTSAWYHIVVAIDTTQSAIADGVKFFVNGVRDTDYDGTPVYNQNATFETGRSGSTTAIGMLQVNSSQFFDGYISEFHFIDGAQKAVTDFGEFNDNGVWVPKKYSGSYGDNGFFLAFLNSGNPGVDTSGNSQTFASSNFTAQDNTTDTCTNNFATINPLANYFNPATLSEGNTRVDFANDASTNYVISTIGVASGKWYCEVKGVDIPSFGEIGIASRPRQDDGNDDKMTVNVNNYGYTANNGNVKNNNTAGSSYGDSYTDGDMIGIAMDLDNNKLYFSKNGTFQNSGDPTTGSTGTGAFSIAAASTTHDKVYYFAGGSNKNNDDTRMDFNFGNPSFAISSSNADADGHGNFEFAVPSGYFALCTKNLAEYG